MKFILKHKEPSEFIKWKKQEANSIQHYILTKDAESAWDHLPSNPPKIKEEGIFYYSKSKLKTSLLSEQGYICAYCMKKHVNDNKCTIDHLNPKTVDVRKNTFNYKNLLAVCEGKQERDDKNRRIKDDLRHCNNKKENKKIEISPLNIKCEEKFIFTEKGEIIGKSRKAKSTIKKLGLDCKVLTKKREESITSLVRPYIDKNILISKEDCAIELEKLKNEKVDSGFTEFYVAIYQQLIKYI